MQYAVGDVGVVVDIATLSGMMQPVSSKILKKLGFESHHSAIQLSRTVAHFVPLRVARNYKNLIIKQVDTRHLLQSNKLKTQPPFFWCCVEESVAGECVCNGALLASLGRNF